MADNFNTISGWVLAGGIAALGLSIGSGMYFHADKDHRPEKMGYVIEGVVSSEAGATAEVPIETLLATADAAKGEAVFKKCVACHTITPGGANGIGPNLHGIMGLPIGKHAAGFAYSPALSGKGGNWGWQEMNDWLANPRKFAEGTKMTFAGLGNPEDRANIMVYMNSQGSSLPIPAAAAAPAADAAAAPAADGAAAPSADAAAAPAAPAPAPAPAGTAPAPAPAQ